MTNYRTGDSVEIHGCNYEIMDNYLSAKSNGSYPKVLARILGIADINGFVSDTLGYSDYNGKKFGFKSIEDANKLIDALRNFSGVSVDKSTILSEASIKKFFDNEMNLVRLEDTSKDAGELLANFGKIRAISQNVVAKITKKNAELVKAIDSKNVSAIERLEKELKHIKEYITDTNDVLLTLNKMGEASAEEVEEFDVEDFMNS